MSLSLHPREVVQALRPPANWVLGSVTISNNNEQYVAFEIHSKKMDTKFKTRQYFSRPACSSVLARTTLCLRSLARLCQVGVYM
ncbi:hypothetical protein HYPSUDRAFT_532996 [Hypholoma sublateritium FD-334 SS-4]|uniref:MSP domain-containing protein n=1 Tax=Hypholoma sublateritium (strain FD-334 SS-4) TaxID=945553 RepID=A0A0D2N338_HYPSF|nr:hypothetical protein HYPSUDRAFT_532996 [Hypholoma sublateritium FD-334 SS-4]